MRTTKAKTIDIADINVRIAIAYALFLIVALLTYIAFLK